jgi:hypothetical protein
VEMVVASFTLVPMGADVGISVECGHVASPSVDDCSAQHDPSLNIYIHHGRRGQGESGEACGGKEACKYTIWASQDAWKSYDAATCAPVFLTDLSLSVSGLSHYEYELTRALV